jgi:hypothetical protein
MDGASERCGDEDVVTGTRDSTNLCWRPKDASLC